MHRNNDTVSDCAWKPNWHETQQHFNDWWRHQGLVVSTWGGWNCPELGVPREPAPEAGPADDVTRRTDTAWVVRNTHWGLARHAYPLDCLPMVHTGQLGPGALATYLGSEPVMEPTTVWYKPCISDPDSTPPLRFDPRNRWWRMTDEQLRALTAQAAGKYLIGCPDLVENIDVLASLRDAQALLLDMLERPAWVEQKLWEINAAWFEAYQRIYDIIKFSDGSSCFEAFNIWGSGKTAKLQCDASAMFSPAMFKQFVVPALTRQCEWLDHSLFHLDGHQCLCHLDHLLAIPALDAIEWTPDPQVPPGGSPHWYDLYRRILAAGKRVQVLGAHAHEIEPLLDAVGADGIYFLSFMGNEAEAEAFARVVERARGRVA